MRVSGVNGTDYMASGAAGMSSGAEQTDEVSRNLQRQIEDLQKQMKELSANQETSPEIKMKKRQELQKQISDLQLQLRQHQMEVKREETQKKEEKASSENVFDSCKISEEGQKQSAGLSAGSMEAMISADASMKQADVHGSTARKMEDRAGVLESEIKLDQARGGNTAAKEEELAAVKATADKATASQMESLSEANEVMREAAEEEKSEAGSRTEEDRQSMEAGQKEGTVAADGQTAADTAVRGTGSMESQTEGMPKEQDESRKGYHPVDVRI